MMIFLIWLLSLSSSLVLEGHYKLWDSASTKYLYDYSLKLHHLEISSKVQDSVVFTDRGMYMRDSCQIYLPSNQFAPSTASQNQVFSMWAYFLTEGRLFLVRDTRYSSETYMLRIVTNFNLNTESKIRYIREYLNPTPLTHKNNSGNLYGARWRFLVVWFEQQGSNTKVTMYVNTIQMFQFTVSDFYINQPTISWIINSEALPFSGIMYELWWHNEMSSVSELDSVMTSSSFYISTLSLNLPTYDFTYNSANQLCPNTCTSVSLSCDSSLKCIGASKSSCYYDLLQATTNLCIFNCPNNSCVCSTAISFTCNCKIGYKKINDNPIACLDVLCESYTQNGYLYTCTKCVEGYILDTDNSCKCDSGYIIKQTNPLKCAWDTFRCIDYTEGLSLYICSRCQEGYTLGCSGRCCVCDANAGYKEFIESPIKCGYDVFRCSNYIEGSTLFKCSSCIEGYTLDSSGTICICDTNAGYREFIASPIKCGYEVFRCANYLEGENLFKCSRCIVGYSLDVSGNLCVCDANAGYRQFIASPIKCGLEVLRCAHYYEDEDFFRCSECIEGYKLEDSGKNCICDTEAGYNQIKDNPTKCGLEVVRCIQYSESESLVYCSKCETGYALDYSSKYCICDKGYVQVLNNPIECTLKVDNCSSYQKTDHNWLCTDCYQGYVLDQHGKCNQCDIGYSIISTEPFICSIEVHGCLTYGIHNDEWICEECKVGYVVGCNGRCCECDLERGFIVVSQYHNICALKISNCLEYDIETEGLKCKFCDYGYVLDSEGTCNSCETNYILVSSMPAICIERAPHCEEYKLEDQNWNCIRCALGYTLNVFCIPEIKFCKEYRIIDNQPYCIMCEDSFELNCGTSCEYSSSCKCKDGFYLSADDTCQLCPDNCITCEIKYGNKVCLSCKSSYSLVDYTCISPENNNYSSLSNAAITFSTQITSVAISTSSASNLLSLNLQGFLSMFGTIEAIYYILLYNIEIPRKVQAILEGVSFFTILPNIAEYCVVYQDTLEIERYNRVGIYNELIFINSGKLIAILILILIIVFLLKIIDRFATKWIYNSSFKKVTMKVQEMVEWNLIIGYLMQGSLQLTITCLINCIHVNFSSTSSVIGFIISVMLLVRYIQILIITSIFKLFLFYLQNHKAIKEDTCGYRYKVLYENMRTEKVDVLLFNLILMMRRVVYGVNVILFYPSPYIQVVVNSVLSFSICYFIINLRPYKNKRDNLMTLYLEFNTFLIFTIVGVYIKEDLSYTLYSISEWSLLVLIYISVTVPAVVNVTIVAVTLIFKSIKYFKNLNHSPIKENITTNNI